MQSGMLVMQSGVLVMQSAPRQEGTPSPAPGLGQALAAGTDWDGSGVCVSKASPEQNKTLENKQSSANPARKQV